jgi:biotin synthase
MKTKEPTWSRDSIEKLYEKPFFELVNQAYTLYRKNFTLLEIELCSLLSIKTGACSENCAYCAQSKSVNHTQSTPLINIESVLKQARTAKEKGAIRFCMSASGKKPLKEEFPHILEMIREVKKLGLETCMTLGLLSKDEAIQLKKAGLDVYNHNIDTSETYYTKIINTHTYEDRINTLKNVGDAGLEICCGGILGMGESRQDRIDFLYQLLCLPTPPTKIPLNRLVPIQGTPLAKVSPIDTFEFIRTVAVTRILFPKAIIRLAAGRRTMSKEMQAFCFMAGANSIFYGNKLLTVNNSEEDDDMALLDQLNIKIKESDAQDITE